MTTVIPYTYPMAKKGHIPANPFQKGNPGNPNGYKNAHKMLPWKRALDKELREYNPKRHSKVEHYMVLRDIARALIDQAVAGNMDAIKEIGNRMDGKSTEHKLISKSVTHEFGDVSRAFGILSDLAGARVIDGDARVVQDGPVLSLEVRPEAEGCGEELDFLALTRSAVES